MDVRLPLKIGLLLLMSGCSPSEEKRQVSLDEKTAQFAQSLETIEDPTLRNAVAQLGGSLLMLERTQLKLDSAPGAIEYSEDVLALFKHYPAPQALVDTFINGLFVLHKDTSSDYLTDLQPVFPFTFNTPGDFLFPHGLEWKSVTLSDQRVIPFRPEWSEIDPGIQLSPSSANLSDPEVLTVTYPIVDGLDADNQHPPQPVSLQGHIEVLAPHRLYRVDLTKQDEGQTRTYENLSIRLLKLDSNFAEVEFRNTLPLAAEAGKTPLNPLIIQARDRSGRVLARAGAINETAAQIDFYQKQLAKLQQQKAWTAALEKQLDEEQQAFEKQHGEHYSRVYFNGPVASLEISLLDFSAATVTRRDLNLPVRRFDAHTTQQAIQPLSLPVVVYDDHAATWLQGASLSAEQLKNSVSIHQSVEDPSAARIEFARPQTFNDELLGTALNPGESPVTFFTENTAGQRDEPIELPTEAYQIDPVEGTITYDLNLFADTPAYAVGSFPLFLATIEQKTLDVRQLPEGLEIRDNALVIDRQFFAADEWRFFAKDDSGNYLKQILSVSHDATAQGPALRGVQYFYGRPARLETYQRTHLSTLQYGFEVRLDKAPLSRLDP